MSKKETVIGVDVGGTKIHIGLYTAKRFSLLKELKVPTNAQRGLEAVLKDVGKYIKEFQDETTIAAGVGLPGYVDIRRSIIHLTPNIPHEGPIYLKAFFKGHFDIPIFFVNDVNLFTLTEYNQSCKKKYKNMVGLAIGTGLGGGVIINGELYRGHHGFAGEFGHISVNNDKELEDFLSGRGNKKTLGKYLGIAIANVIHLFDPEAIALGGSVMKEFPRIKKNMWKEIKKRVITKSVDKIHLYVSKIKNPATLGAAILAAKKTKDA